MKKILLAATAGMLAFASSCQEKPAYTIQGILSGAADGDFVYMQDYVDGGMVNMDSAEVKGGAFQFKGVPDSVTVSRYIAYTKGDQPKSAMVFLENGTIKLDLDGDFAQVSGTVCNDAYQKFMNSFIALNKEMREIYTQMQSDSTLTDDQRAAMEKQLQAKDEEGTKLVYETIEENIGNLVGIQMLTSYAEAFEVAEVQAMLDKVPAAYVNDPEVVALKDHIALLAKTAVGQKYIDFTSTTPEGKEAKISDFVAKNKYTLIDFWASWCGPCRAEMPNVVKAYADFKSKGFGIVSYSLDNDEAAWKKGIKDLKMTWPQLSDLKSWESEPIKAYGIQGIPATVLVDAEGTIVARNLRGEELLTKLAELMK